MLIKDGLVVIEMAPKRIAKFVDLLVCVLAELSLCRCAGVVCLQAQRIQRVTLDQDTRETPIRVAHNSLVGVV